MAVSYTPDTVFRPSAPIMLWKAGYTAGNGASCGMPAVSSSNDDVTSDGQRFLMIKEDASALVGRNVVVVLNWTEELKRRSATSR